MNIQDFNRETYFKKESSTIEMTYEAWKSCWKYIDNIWRVRHRSTAKLLMECRLKATSPVISRKTVQYKHNSCDALAVVLFKQSSVVLNVQTDHSHYIELCESFKLCSYVQNFIKEELLRGYSVTAVQELVEKVSSMYPKLGFMYVSRRQIAMIQKRFVEKETPSSKDLNSVLSTNGFFVCHKKDSDGTIIGSISKEQLKCLQDYGNELVVIDATENTNVKGYLYVTAVVRVTNGKWLPVFQFWVSHEKSRLYVLFLRWILHLSEYKWKPNNVVIDGSRVEEKALKEVFGKAIAVFNCTRHSMQALYVRVGNIPTVLASMRAAVYSPTFEQCQRHYEMAVENSPYEELKRYLKRAWSLKRSSIWGVHARRTGIAAEIVTSNPVESLFSRIKNLTRSDMSLTDSVETITKFLVQVFDKWKMEINQETVTCIPRVVEINQSVAQWSQANQKKILKEFDEAKELVSEGKLDSLFVQANNDVTCKCRFYRFNMVPCKHILGRNIEMNGMLVTAEHWRAYAARMR